MDWNDQVTSDAFSVDMWLVTQQFVVQENMFSSLELALSGLQKVWHVRARHAVEVGTV